MSSRPSLGYKMKLQARLAHAARTGLRNKQQTDKTSLNSLGFSPRTQESPWAEPEQRGGVGVRLMLGKTGLGRKFGGNRSGGVEGLFLLSPTQSLSLGSCPRSILRPACVWGLPQSNPADQVRLHAPGPQLWVSLGKSPLAR